MKKTPFFLRWLDAPNESVKDTSNNTNENGRNGRSTAKDALVSPSPRISLTPKKTNFVSALIFALLAFSPLAGIFIATPKLKAAVGILFYWTPV